MSEWPSQSCSRRVSCPASASKWPQVCRNWCGWQCGRPALFAAMSISLATFERVIGPQRSVAKTKTASGCCSRLSSRKARSSSSGVGGTRWAPVAKRLRLLAPQAVPPVPAADSSDRNGALAPLDSRPTTASGSIRCAVASSRPWSASRPRESVQPNPQIHSCGLRPTTDRQSADKQLSNVDR